MVCGNTFAKTICSICYEDLKPVVEDLQSISICGHVFHELCLQQWFEYCSNAKKRSCPVCKQNCSEANVSRLYFQSVGDSSLSQKPINCEEIPEELQGTIEKLEGKVSALTSAFGQCQKEVKELSEQLYSSKDQAKKEAAWKSEALREKASIQQLLDLKKDELHRSTLECKRVQQGNVALAKEFALFKLAYDCDLKGEEIQKLASLANNAGNKNEVDLFKKLLETRNKDYKELMRKCTLLGSGEACYRRKYEEKKLVIKKLKARIQEVEAATEAKDNEVLRALKASKKITPEENVANNFNWSSNSSSINKSFDNQLVEPAKQKFDSDQVRSTAIDSRKIKKLRPSENTDMTSTNNDRSTFSLAKGISSHFLNETVPEVTAVVHEVSQPDLEPRITEVLTSHENSFSRSDTPSDKKSELHRPCNKDGVSSSRSSSKVDMAHNNAAMDEDIVLILDDIKQVQSLADVEKENLCPVQIAQPGDICFSGGLLGPDGTKRHLGKWCKRVQDKVSMVSSVKTQTRSTDLISVGADGRGGKIKVLKSVNQTSLDSREPSTLGKRSKNGAKTSSLQSQGCLQIEHFFGRAGH